MDTFELFNNGKLVLPEKEAGFAGIEWSKHPTFEGVELNHIITAKDTDGKFSYHSVRLTLGCSIGNHIFGFYILKKVFLYAAIINGEELIFAGGHVNVVRLTLHLFFIHKGIQGHWQENV